MDIDHLHWLHEGKALLEQRAILHVLKNSQVLYEKILSIPY
jgi:hypothetical protein